MIDKNRLLDLLSPYEIALSTLQLEQLDEYARLLVEWNEKINLTAITAPEEIEEKHFLDCLLLAARPEVDGALVDVGSGAGFPGLVVKIFKPQLPVTLMEPTGKRLAFLAEAAGRLGLAADLVKERAEEAARKEWRQRYAVATARAVAALPQLCEYCLPLVKPGGIFIAMKGAAAEEAAAAAGAMQLLGGELMDICSYTLPSGAQRDLVLIKKGTDTPDKYPRGGGAIAKRPL